MAYLVVGYPTLSEKDFNWIQEYRRENDPRYYSVINPHFTIVFPVHDLEKEVFIAEVEKLTKDVKKFNFEIKVATINQDDSKEYFHEFLVPDKGYSDIIKLHDKLYSESFLPFWRYDLDFIPHIGIGNSDEVTVSKKRIDQLNSEEISIEGSIESLDIIEYKDGKVETIKKIELKESTSDFLKNLEVSKEPVV